MFKDLVRGPALAVLAGGLMLFAGSAAFGAEEATPRTITVSGQAEIKAVPDEAQLSAGVVTQARDAADALAQNSRAMNEVFAALKRLGVPEKSIQTSDFSVSPQYHTDQHGNTTQKIDFYQVSNTVNVTVDDLTKVGPAIDALVASGANTLGGIGFTIRDPKPLMAEARAAAVKDAIDRAETMTKAAGVALGPIASMSEQSYEMPRPMYRSMAMSAGIAAPTPVAAGEEGLTASVSITWELR